MQDVPGGKANILGGHSTGHSKCTCVLFRTDSETGISPNILKIGDNKEISRTVSDTGIYCSSDKVGIVYLV
jgi:hypothetical protein